ncbi:nucleotidyl transferase AbiEii/AbiGii toxin family protein [Arcobacter sp.]|uniref:nucleotidyl transferase AbiEii/AbiGii toxin family protein n=1 Tax=Arcobacter sp. TaxID=1872629 RepID=UPI003D0C62BE
MATAHPHIEAMLKKYDLTKDDPFEALREILQEIVLAALSDAGFFKHAVFYGGTALRILYNLPRFSEDLDFSLIKPDPSFDLSKYEKAVIDKLQTYGFEAQIQTKIKDTSAVQSAFLKGNTLKHLIAINAPDDIIKTFHSGKTLKIKFEVDTNPPINFNDEEKLHLLPSPFMIRTMTPSSLFAGKIHAILCRGWKTRPKGRDWYDLVWYVQSAYELDLFHLATRLTGGCKALESIDENLPNSIEGYSEENIKNLLQKRIETLDIELAKDDVKRFISDENELNIWSKEFFSAIANMIKFTK